MNGDDLERFDIFEEFDEEAAHPELHYCSFRVGEKHLCIPIEAVREITDPSELLPLPGSPSHLRGLMHLRGEVIPVVDLAVIYGTSYDHDAEKKLIITEINREPVAMLSDGMPDLLEEEQGEFIDLESFFEKYRVA